MRLIMSLFSMTQQIHFMRHGQALHNVRAEGLRSEGCSFETFINTMREDDALDADLTPLGREQAAAARAALGARAAGAELLVASPLSRALETAQLVFPELAAAGDGKFVCVEELREWSGQLVNARRRSRAELRAKFPACDFSGVPEEDETWDAAALETEASVRARGVRVLRWLAARPEREIAVVAHGGIYSALFKPSNEWNVSPVVDEAGLLSDRFHNCEVRTVRLAPAREDGRFVVSGAGDITKRGLGPV